MKYKRFGEDIVVRLEVGEEVVASLAEIAEREGVTFAEVSGIGAADEFDVSVHIHAAACRRDGTAVGGHLKRAVISATCELVLHTVYGRVPRFYDERTGLNLMEL